jgi:hypothetical protein
MTNRVINLSPDKPAVPEPAHPRAFPGCNEASPDDKRGGP